MKRKRVYHFQWFDFPDLVRYHILEIYIKSTSKGRDDLSLVCKEFRDIKLSLFRDAFRMLKTVQHGHEYHMRVFLNYFFKCIHSPGYFAIVNFNTEEWLGCASCRYPFSNRDDHGKVERYDGLHSLGVMEKKDAVEYAIRTGLDHVMFCFPNRCQAAIVGMNLMPKFKVHLVSFEDVLDMLWYNELRREEFGEDITTIPTYAKANSVFYLTFRARLDRVREKTVRWFRYCNLVLMGLI